MSEIYQPAEDSYLLSDVLRKNIQNKEISVLDMGSGSGIQARTLIEIGIPEENITLVDINKDSIKHLKKKFSNSRIIYSDLFNKISKNQKFDLIIFNPPYLPENRDEPKSSRTATTGGLQGSEIINKFLKQAKNHLNKNGRIFLLTSSLTQGVFGNNWEKKLLGKKKLFMEELYVWGLRPKGD